MHGLCSAGDPFVTLSRMTTRAIFFPFDLFGSPGTKAGAEMLADAFEEMLADNRREKGATRARAYAGQIRFEEITFDTVADYAAWQDQARERVRRALQKDEFLLWITGNHLGALPIFEELAQHSKKTLVLQLDAHLDIYNLSDCATELTHGNFILRAKGPMPPIVNVGHRELLLRPEHIRKHYRAAFSAAELAIDRTAVLAKIATLCADHERVFLDLDCDALDPAVFPAVSEPRPFGVNGDVILQLLALIGAERLGGVSISEFNPGRDANDVCLATLMWLIEYVLLLKHE
jgi:agmatinase